MGNNPENKDNQPKSNSDDGSLIESLFADKDRHGVPDQDIFVGGENLFDSFEPAPAADQSGSIALGKVKKAISVCIFAVLVAFCAILAYPILKPKPADPAVSILPPVGDQKPAQPVADPRKTAVQTTMPTLKDAESLFATETYDEAYDVYEGVRRITTQNTENAMLLDFLWLRMGQCRTNTNKLPEANQLLRAAAKGSSPIVSILANYDLALNYLEQKLFLQSRASAYKAIALADAVKYDQQWIESLKSSCHFITSESMTRYALALCDQDENAPQHFRKNTSEMADPFKNVGPGQLRLLLSSGSEKLFKSLASPIIKRNVTSAGPLHYNITCYNASIEEVIAKFAANADLEITGALGTRVHSDEVRKSLADKFITMYLPEVTADDFVALATGCTGLAASWKNDSTVDIYNPYKYDSLSGYIKTLNSDAVELWQKIILTYQDDNYLPGAHFGLALIYSQDDKLTEAISEYRLVANRFPDTNLAKLSLLYSAKLKSRLHDYTGAHKDLSQLVEEYPGSKIAGEALLYLADSTLKTLQYTEAGRLYNKVYFFTADSDTQTNAALGAGKAFYALGDTKSALKWLGKFIEHTKYVEHPDIYSACHLLGKIYYDIGDLPQACSALQCALAGTLSKEDSVSAVKMLVDGYVQQEDYVQALHVLEDRYLYSLASEKYDDRLLIKSETLRAIGLFDDDILTIKNRMEYIVDSSVKAKLMYELALCYKTKDELEGAREFFMQALDLSENESFSLEIACELADTCLKLEHFNQVITMCNYILDSSSDNKQKTMAENLIAKAYYLTDDFDNALSALAEPQDMEAVENGSGISDKVANRY